MLPRELLPDLLGAARALHHALYLDGAASDVYSGGGCGGRRGRLLALGLGALLLALGVGLCAAGVVAGGRHLRAAALAADAVGLLLDVLGARQLGREPVDGPPQAGAEDGERDEVE